MMDDNINEYYRMRSMYEDAVWRSEELSHTLSEIDFLVESDTSRNETLRKIREVLDECPVQYPHRDKLF